MKYAKLKAQPTFNENPFVEQAINDIKVVRKTQVVRPENRDEIQMITSTDGEITGYTAFMRFVELDEERFAKVYLSQFTAFWELTKPAIRVFGYILSILKPKQDEFFLEMDKCLAYTKYTHANSVLSGLAVLVECGIIARSNSHFKYFINPLVVFNGDRVTFAKTYVKKKKDKEKQDRNQLDLFQQEALRLSESPLKLDS
ncbi:hypothetical protein GCM10023189_36480 [Nibrella saemangeumensis]|uniref:Plasmid replication protein RepL domain-containing protein n=1 Tax=Nibrella saemangeumensis TaxID=1084526 RepID=A0ABP8N7X6_9BACT